MASPGNRAPLEANPGGLGLSSQRLLLPTNVKTREHVASI